MIDAIVFLGIQGSGKGTQAKLLEQRTGFQHVNIGDLLREQVSLGTDIGDDVKSTIQKGELAPNEVVFGLIDGSLKADCRGVIFDGFPRTLTQARYLIDHYNLVRVYYLDLKKDEAIQRIHGRRVCSQCGTNYHMLHHPPKKEGICDLCGGKLITRDDDSPKAIQRRVAAFFRKTYTLRSFFQDKGVLKNLPAAKSITEIQNMILEDIKLD
ncbi:MAG: nucleoside monophosphate kinase [Candidatus Cloacimonadaceae bacterium]|jgi:adenylate kinase|nr:nucleoside monophosphate kinase [Candidatus Cloacimonadota bacterium]MDY0127753.1 nucleoside monophosphate kinase [Candidatus Cloacimonadaceae bacterium]MCB5255822.1 nucleoside monophosphate kinase [Candidatus Cloacimonadota bacterium]MCK9178077.1 nucleoside monophosphate kinase [Candidatus Cloacimonadota bacterium]MCK9242295.1 nucleoside monophosphate kinase [Candidatus Cloacimonadota bacterium]